MDEEGGTVSYCQRAVRGIPPWEVEQGTIPAVPRPVEQRVGHILNTEHHEGKTPQNVGGQVAPCKEMKI